MATERKDHLGVVPGVVDRGDAAIEVAVERREASLQMDVHVHEAGHDRVAVRVNHARVLRNLDGSFASNRFDCCRGRENRSERDESERGVRIVVRQNS